MNSKFNYFTLVPCLICEREMKPEDSWIKPLNIIEQTYPVKVIMEIIGMKGFESRIRNIYLCDYHYKEIKNKIEKGNQKEGGETNVQTRRSIVYSS